MKNAKPISSNWKWFLGKSVNSESLKYFFPSTVTNLRSVWDKRWGVFPRRWESDHKKFGVSLGFPKRDLSVKRKKQGPFETAIVRPMININVCLGVWKRIRGNIFFWERNPSIGFWLHSAQDYAQINFGVCCWIIMWKASLGSRRETPFISSDTPNQLLPSEWLLQPKQI